MNQINLIFTLPDNQSQSWVYWNEIQHYGPWLRHIGDFHSILTIGDITVEPWSKREKKRAKEISNKYSPAHSVGAPGPNDTVKVAYRYKRNVKNFSMSRTELSVIREEVLLLVSKQMEVVCEVSCAVCGASSEEGPVRCGHLDYQGIDTQVPALLMRPPATEVAVIVDFRSDISKGTRFTQGLLMPTLAKGADIERLGSPAGSAVPITVRRDKDRIRIPLYKPDEGPTGIITELGLLSEGILIFYSSV